MTRIAGAALALCALILPLHAQPQGEGPQAQQAQRKEAQGDPGPNKINKSGSPK